MALVLRTEAWSARSQTMTDPQTAGRHEFHSDLGQRLRICLSLWRRFLANGWPGKAASVLGLCPETVRLSRPTG
jgi:hypothetical protein